MGRVGVHRENRERSRRRPNVDSSRLPYLRRRDGFMKGRFAAEWSRIGLLALMPLLLARPAGAQGQLRLVLEGEAGLRNDGDYGLQQQDPAVRRNQDLARAGLDLQLSYARERLNLALGYSPS